MKIAFVGALFFLVLLHLHILGRRRGHSLGVRTFTAWAATSLFYLGGTVLWLPTGIKTMTSSSWLVTIILYLGFVTFSGVAGWGSAVGSSRKSSTLANFLVPAFFYSITSTGLDFRAVLSPGEFLSEYSFFRPILATLGSFGLTILTTSALALTYCFFSSRESLSTPTRRLTFAIIATIFGGLLSSNHFNSAINHQKTENSSQRLKVLAVQANTQREDFLDPMMARPRFRRLFQTISDQAGKEKPDLIILPEAGVTQLPLFSVSDFQAERWRTFADPSLGETMRSTHAFWLITQNDFVQEPHPKSLDKDSAPSPQIATVPTAFLYSNYGYLLDKVSKKKLIPFVESVPEFLRFPIVQKFFSWAKHMELETERRVIAVNDFAIGVMICYDSVFRSVFRDLAKQNVNGAVVLTNDRVLSEAGGWFHRLTTQALAIESNVPVMFVGNAGHTGMAPGEGLEWGTESFASLELNSSRAIVSKTRTTLNSIGVKLAWINEWMCLIVIFALMLFAVMDSAYLFREARVRFLKFKHHASVRYVLKVSMITLILFLFVDSKIVEVANIPSESMRPAFQAGDHVFLCKWGLSSLRRGDVIAFREPIWGRTLLKRIFLQPKDNWQFSGSQGMLNGVLLEHRLLSENLWSPVGDPELRLESQTAMALVPTFSISVPEGSFFVLGDHRDKSRDSRIFGFVSASDIQGVACGVWK